MGSASSFATPTARVCSWAASDGLNAAVTGYRGKSGKQVREKCKNVRRGDREIVRLPGLNPAAHSVVSRSHVLMFCPHSHSLRYHPNQIPHFLFYLSRISHRVGNFVPQQDAVALPQTMHRGFHGPLA